MANFYGTNDNDTLTGSKDNDTLEGYGGDDYLYGGDGDDTLAGGYLYTGKGKTLIGSDDGGSNNYLSGGAGNDHMYGSDGNDALYGGDGDDFISGRSGNDKVYAGAGNDTVYGSDGDDVMYGDWDGVTDSYNAAGNDVLFGGLGNDWLWGDTGNDFLGGGLGNNYLDGGAGLDMAQYDGSRSEYTVSSHANKVSGANVSDTLLGIERIYFSNIALAFDIDGSAGTVARLMGALYGKENDFVAAGSAIKTLDNGGTEFAAAQVLLENKFLNNRDMVYQVYSNVVGQAPSNSALADYTNQLDRGVHTQESLLIFAAHTALNESNVNLIGLQETGLAYI
jgi:Ca2+-binding RTX toxin-like protein